MCPSQGPGADLEIVLLSHLFHREDNQAVRQAVQHLPSEALKT